MVKLLATLSLVFISQSSAWMSSRASFSTRRSSFLLYTTPTDADASSSNPNPCSDRREWIQQALALPFAATSSTLVSPVRADAAVAPKVSKSICDPTVSVWQRDDRLVYLLGTAHISEVSANLAGSLVDDVHPNAVFIELDLKRVANVAAPNKSPPLEGPPAAEDTLTASTTTATESTAVIPKVVVPRLSPIPESPTTALATATATTDPESSPSPKPQPSWWQRGALNFAAAAVGNALRSMYSNLSDSGFNPGEEFAVAIREAQKIGADVVLGDQDVEVTLRRLTQALARTDLNRLMDSELDATMSEMMGSGRTVPPERRDYEDASEFKADLSSYVENLKSRETVRKLMGELRTVAPELVQVMLTERDVYMARGLDTLNDYECIVAVMGIAHQDGVEENLRLRGWKPVRLSCAAFV